ncbi:MAG: energy-coupling factor transporter ATPase [Mycoplasma sp.]|nr:energy-coupling factor transporter ATPase [Mycoplasma sp.]
MIKVKDLTFKYFGNKTNALNKVSFEIKEGEYIAILGHNGSGKSTLSKLLVGLYKPNDGFIEINGIRIAKENLKEIRKYIGIVFQNPDNQFIGTTVEDDIAFGLENKMLTRPQMKKIIQELSARVGMREYLDRAPQNLSGGQKQRVAIASTLALDPKVIIFDEVTSMLDPKGKKEVISIIKEIQQSRKKTLISITHDMDEAILADKILVFSQGQLIASGAPAEILKNKEIVNEAKIDAPFIYKLSSKINKVEATYDEKKLVGDLCK